MPVRLNSSGGGSVTLDVPAVGTTTTLNLPTSNGTLLASDGSGNVTVSGAATFSGNATFNAGLIPSSSFLRNRLINGGFQIWQRGTSFSSVSFGTYGADRWAAGANTITFTRSTDVPAGFQFSISVAQSSADFGTIVQRIESANIYDLAGQPVTVSFWARSTAGTTDLEVALDYANAVDNFSATTRIQTIEVSANPSGSWTRYTASFNALPSQAVNGIQLLIYRGSAAANTTLYTGVQLEVGSVATPFERRQYGQELALCQRYARVLGGGMLGRWGGTGGGEIFTIIEPMRSNPSVSLLSTTATFFRVGIVALSGTGIFIVGFSTTANGMAVTFGMNSTGANAGEFMALVSDILLANAEL